MELDVLNVWLATATTAWPLSVTVTNVDNLHQPVQPLQLYTCTMIRESALQIVQKNFMPTQELNLVSRAWTRTVKRALIIHIVWSAVQHIFYLQTKPLVLQNVQSLLLRKMENVFHAQPAAKFAPTNMFAKNAMLRISSCQPTHAECVLFPTGTSKTDFIVKLAMKAVKHAEV